MNTVRFHTDKELAAMLTELRLEIQRIDMSSGTAVAEFFLRLDLLQSDAQAGAAEVLQRLGLLRDLIDLKIRFVQRMNEHVEAEKLNTAKPSTEQGTP